VELRILPAENISHASVFQTICRKNPQQERIEINGKFPLDFYESKYIMRDLTRHKE